MVVTVAVERPSGGAAWRWTGAPDDTRGRPRTG